MHSTPFLEWVQGQGPKANPSYVYIASSWRNPLQQAIVGMLKSLGIPHYDFRNPVPGNDGFRWFEIDPAWETWNVEKYKTCLNHDIAKAGYQRDFDALERADCGILVLPCGRSAHLEAGYLAGQGKPVFTVCFEHQEPELMTLLLGPSKYICSTTDQLFDNLGVD